MENFHDSLDISTSDEKWATPIFQKNIDLSTHLQFPTNISPDQHLSLLDVSLPISPSTDFLDSRFFDRENNQSWADFHDDELKENISEPRHFSIPGFVSSNCNSPLHHQQNSPHKRASGSSPLRLPLDGISLPNSPAQMRNIKSAKLKKKASVYASSPSADLRRLQQSNIDRKKIQSPKEIFNPVNQNDPKDESLQKSRSGFKSRIRAIFENPANNCVGFSSDPIQKLPFYMEKSSLKDASQDFASGSTFSLSSGVISTSKHASTATETTLKHAATA
eukprot:Sdes_comp21403_c0_seq1m20038